MDALRVPKGNTLIRRNAKFPKRERFTATVVQTSGKLIYAIRNWITFALTTGFNTGSYLFYERFCHVFCGKRDDSIGPLSLALFFPRK